MLAKGKNGGGYYNVYANGWPSSSKVEGPELAP